MKNVTRVRYTTATACILGLGNMEYAIASCLLETHTWELLGNFEDMFTG